MGGRSERKVVNGLGVEGCLLRLLGPRGYINISRNAGTAAPTGRIPTPRAAIAQSFRNPYWRRGASMPRGDAVKGVGKFGEVMAGEKGKAEYGASLEKLHRVVHSGSQPKAILDFLVRGLRRGFPPYNWVGGYPIEGDKLVLKAWSGPHPTQHVRIPIGQGICGLAARTRETVVVGDVSADPRYLECFPETRSEIVVPILRQGVAIGEIDIDSNELDAFSNEDRALLEDLAGELAKVL